MSCSKIDRSGWKDFFDVFTKLAADGTYAALWDAFTGESELVA